MNKLLTQKKKNKRKLLYKENYFKYIDTLHVKLDGMTIYTYKPLLNKSLLWLGNRNRANYNYWNYGLGNKYITLRGRKVEYGFKLSKLCLPTKSKDRRKCKRRNNINEIERIARTYPR